MSATLDRILSKAVDGGRLTPDEGVELFRSRDLLKLGRAAHAVCSRLHPEPYRTGVDLAAQREPARTVPIRGELHDRTRVEVLVRQPHPERP